MHKQLAALLITDGLNLDRSLVLIYVVKDAEIADAEFPFRQLVGAEPLPVACLLARLIPELPFDGGDDLLLVELSQQAQVRDGFGRELDPEHSTPVPRNPTSRSST